MRNRSLVLILAFRVLPLPAFVSGVEVRLREADKELNRVYEQLQADLASKPQQSLKRPQRAWIEYRDHKCAVEASMNGDGEEDWISSVSPPGWQVPMPRDSLSPWEHRSLPEIPGIASPVS